MDELMQPMIRSAIESVVFSTIGIVFFGIAFWVMNKVVPFSIRKEIEDDHNTALAIVIGSVILGIAMILSAALHG
jgi:uncharacterized membrane protein YjfL (UPF0719 family)